MYKNLNAAALGISGRQSELIELALTYGFKGLDVDITDLVKRTQRTDIDRASRYLISSKMKVSGFEIPIDLDTDDVSFEKSMLQIPQIAEVAGKVFARAGFVKLPAATDRLAFPEYFEMMRKRVDRIAEVFAKNGVKLGIGFSSAIEDRKECQFKFIQDVETFLAFFSACNSNVAIVVDTYDWIVSGGTIEQISNIAGDRIATLRIADVETMPTLAESSVSMRQLSGTSGLVDNVRFVHALAKNGYDGAITSFAHAGNFAGMTRDSIVAKSQDALDNVLEGAGLPTFTRRPDMVVESTTPILEDIGLEA